jgi:uncharacterized protein YukE
MIKCKLILGALITLVCLSGCGRGDILGKQKLEDILVEIHLSDGVFHTLSHNNILQDVDSVFRYKNIFEKFNCSRNKFEKSMREYSRNKENLDKIYANVQKRLEEMLKNYEGITFSEFIQRIENKFITPFSTILQTAGKNFENIENFNSFIEKIKSIDENNTSEITDKTEIDSIKQEVPNNKVFKKIKQ